MVKRAAKVSILPVRIDADGRTPLWRQIYSGLREAILTRQMAPGARLPASRTLAAELGVSRQTVVGAFEQLLAEGYLEAKVGAGTRVARELPEGLLSARSEGRRVGGSEGKGRQLSRRGAHLAAIRVETVPDQGAPRAFRAGVPALDAFPTALWARLATRYHRLASASQMTYGDAQGYAPLCEAISSHLRTARGVICQPDQVIVVAGTQAAVDLAARVLLDPGDSVWFEDPGYTGALGALRGSGATIIAVPVDEAGLDVRAGVEACPTARLAYVTPSHQFPTGTTMSLARRLALLDWARRAEAWVLEDDYDSEYRYGGHPLATLHGLDTENRVIYCGTFSKVLFPALRLGYLVVPPDLVSAFVAARALIDRHPPVLLQAILADFIAEGHFGRHLRRMAGLYASRQDALIDAAREKLGGVLEVRPDETGMHLVGWLRPGMDDRVAARRAAAHGVEAAAVSAYGIQPGGRHGLILGYAAFDEETLRAAVERLAMAL